MSVKRNNNPCCGGCKDPNLPTDCSSSSGDCLIFCNITHTETINPCGGTFSVNIFQEGVQHLLGECTRDSVELSIYDYTPDFINVLISGGIVTGLTSEIIEDNPEIRIKAKCGDRENLFCVRISIKDLCKNVTCDESCEICNPCNGACEEVEIDLIGEEIEIQKENC